MIDVYSLMEDACSDLFITQSSGDKNSNNSLSVIGNGSVFLSPCVSIVKSGNVGSNVTQYEDISDDDFDIPCSQMPAANNTKLI